MYFTKHRFGVLRINNEANLKRVKLKTSKTINIVGVKFKLYRYNNYLFIKTF